MSNTYKYGKYISRDQETRWATVEEIRRSGTVINLNDAKYSGSGLPLLSNGREACVDSGDTHSLIFGATGSKKTRLFCMPMINIFAKAGESFIVTDPKGELYERTAGVAKAQGYDIVVLNFRDLGRGDMWNPLALPYELYHNGKKDDAISMLNDFIVAIADRQFTTTNDIFWPEMASSFALANLMLLLECAKPNEMNMASLATLCSFDSETPLSFLARQMSDASLAGMNYQGVLTAPPETKRSIYATLFGMIRVFNTQKSLTAMLSGNTVDVRTFGTRKTAVYLIVPDEKTTYHFLVTAFIKQAYEILIREAQKHRAQKLTVRVNFVLDEFCNMPKVPDMPSMISASRSRNMRFYLVAQSMHQLRGKYGEDADTIKGNCDNWVFLTSKELALLNEISELCGTVQTSDGRSRRLISVSELQRLNKERGEALIIHSREYPIITEIADIDDYEMWKKYSAPDMKTYKKPDVAVFPLMDLVNAVSNKKRRPPFEFGD